jgi:ankyrin repeat protein
LSRGEAEEVRQILAHYKGDVAKWLNEARFEDFSHPLAQACMHGNQKIVQIFLDNGADVAQLDIARDSMAPCLFWSLHSPKANDEVAKLMYEKNPQAINQSHRKVPYTPIMAASQRGNLKMVSFLLEKGANPNFEGPNGMTPLVMALDGMCDPHKDETGQLTAKLVAQRLVQSGAKVDLETESGFTAFWRACMKRMGGQMKMLLDANADANKACFEMSPLSAIIESQDEKPHQCGGHGHGHHHHHTIVPQTSREDCVKLLLEHKGAKIDVNYSNPLFRALTQGYKGVALILLENGADPKQETEEGKTAFDIITEGSDAELKKALKKADGCTVCKKTGSLMRCSRCQDVWYCGKDCQTKDWTQQHKTNCVKK